MLVWDYKNGFIVDEETGLVVDRVYAVDEQYAACPSKLDGKVTVRRDHQSFTTMIPSEDRGKLEVYYNCIKAARKLGVDTVTLREELKRKLIKLELNVRDRVSFAAALLYTVVRELNLSVLSPRMVVDSLNADPFRTWNYYVRFFSSSRASRTYSDILTVMAAALEELGYPRDLFYTCRVLLLNLDEVFISGKSSRGLAAAIIENAKWLTPAVRLNMALGDSKLFLCNIAKVCRITETGVRYIAKQVRKKLGIIFKPIIKYQPTAYDIVKIPKTLYKQLKPILDPHNPFSKLIIPYGEDHE